MELYNRINWNWFFSGSAGDMTFDALASTFGKWRSLVANVTACQVAAMGLIAMSDGATLHCHAMLVGKNRYGQTLADVAPDTIRMLEARWKRMARNSAMVLPAIEGKAVRYVVEDNLLYKWNVRELTPINTKLLMKLSK